MWLIDIHHDQVWLNERDGRLPTPTLRLNIGVKTNNAFSAELFMFSDEGGPRHFRILLLEIKTFEELIRFKDEWLNKIITLMESSITLQSNVPFEIYRPFGSQEVIITYGECISGDNPVVKISTMAIKGNVSFEPKAIATICRSLAKLEIEIYLTNLKRGMNWHLDTDYRWINYYKICERRFCMSNNITLAKEPEWRNFLENHKHIIQPRMTDSHKNQSLWGYFETLRTLAMHVNGASPSGHEKRLESSLPLIRYLAVEIINEFLPKDMGHLNTYANDGSLLNPT